MLNIGGMAEVADILPRQEDIIKIKCQKRPFVKEVPSDTHIRLGDSHPGPLCNRSRTFVIHIKRSPEAGW